MRLTPLLLLPSFAMVSCWHSASNSEFPKMTDEFVYTTLAFSPVMASGQGLHEHNGINFDTQLDDVSFRAIQRQRTFYVDFHKRLESFDRNSLTPEDRADYDILESQTGLALFDIDMAQSWQHSPQTYVELIGNALYNPFVLEYAPKEERFRHIIARMDKIPQFMETARRQLRGAPEEWVKVAGEENQGNIDLIDKTLRVEVPASLKTDYDAAASPALDALRGFNRFLTEGASRRERRVGGDTGEPDWRLGTEKYTAKFKLSLATDRTPDQVLADAESRLTAVRAQMLEISTPLHAKWFPDHKDHSDLTGDARENAIVKEVLDHIAQDHSTPASYMDDARKDLEQTRDFARDKNLLTLPAGSNLQVIPTPEFERGIYGVGGFSPAPVFEPQLGAFFWITPIPPDWPKARVESKLREYNFYNLQLLTIHEAMPGHYVQGEFANQIQPGFSSGKMRGVLRALFSNGPYVEGWAQYITQVMLDEGYMNSAPELRLTLLKQELRVDANAIMDIRLQTNRMTDDQAMDLMEKQTFQEHEEAVAKLQRAKLSSTQLPTYFTGWRDWLRVRELVKQTQGASFSLHDFHDRALKEGGVPLPVLARLLTGKDLQ